MLYAKDFFSGAVSHNSYMYTRTYVSELVFYIAIVNVCD